MRIEELLGIPSNCVIDRLVAKEKVFQNANLNSNDKKLFIDYVNQIWWNSRLAEDSTDIIPYKDDTKKYNEVEILFITLKEEKLRELSDSNKTNSLFFVQDKKIERIIEILFRFILFPQLIVLNYRSKLKFYTTHLTINLVDSTKFTRDEMISTNWIDLNKIGDIEEYFFNNMQFENLSHENFYKFYGGYVDSIIKYNGSVLSGSNIELPVDEIKVIEDRIEELDNEIAILIKELNKETQPRLISKINNKIRIRRIEKRDLLKKLE